MVDQIKCTLSQDVFKVVTSVVIVHPCNLESVGQKVTQMLRGQHSDALFMSCFSMEMMCFTEKKIFLKSRVLKVFLAYIYECHSQKE